MTKKVVFTTLSIAYGFSMLGQSIGSSTKGVAENNLRIASFFHQVSTKEQSLTTDRTLQLADVEGSMYYLEAFIPGQIYHSEKPFKQIPMRYNAFTDEIEVKREGQSSPEALLKDAKISCLLNGERLIYVEHLNKKGDVQKGYLVQHVSGNTYHFYERKSKTFKEGQQPKTSLHIPTPDKFVDKSEFYVAKNSETPKFLPTSQKKLLSFLGDKDGKLKSFIKNNQIDLSEKNDVQRLILFAESMAQGEDGV